MPTQTRSRKIKTKRFYTFGSYDNRQDALRAAKALRKDKSLRAYVKENPRTRKWDTMYAGVRKG